MKIIYKLLFLFLLTIGYSSCDFLDIVPDEITTEADAFKDRNAAKNLFILAMAICRKVMWHQAVSIC